LIKPAHVWVVSSLSSFARAGGTGPAIPVPRGWLSALSKGDEISFKDARDAQRFLRVIARTPQGCQAEIGQTACVIPGTRFECKPAKTKKVLIAAVGELPRKEASIWLEEGDVLRLTKNERPLSEGNAEIPSISCTLPGVFRSLRKGEPIWFDDGKIGGTIEAVTRSDLLIRITHADLNGEKLHADSGINLPESELRLPALTRKDFQDLGFALAHADIIELSFVNSAQVLDSLAKKGIPSRAEITDAAMGGRAECIMLNKGPHIVEAVQALDRILRRMEPHQNKKRATLRRLAVVFQCRQNIAMPLDDSGNLDPVFNPPIEDQNRLRHCVRPTVKHLTPLHKSGRSRPMAGLREINFSWSSLSGAPRDFRRVFARGFRY